jgi:hypothetical protein
MRHVVTVVDSDFASPPVRRDAIVSAAVYHHNSNMARTTGVLAHFAKLGGALLLVGIELGERASERSLEFSFPLSPRSNKH